MRPGSNLTMSVNNIVENSLLTCLNYLNRLKEERANEDNYNNYITCVKDFIYVLINKITDLSKYIYELETQRSNMKQCHNKMSDEIYKLNKKITEQEEEIKTFAEICKDSLIEENTCNICFTKAKTHINTTCGHKSVCYSCSEKLENKCPICRSNGNFIRIIST